MDYILNGQASGGVAATLLQNNFNLGALRPYVGKDGRTYISQPSFNAEGKKIYKSVLAQNATGTLRPNEWKMIDDSVIMSARSRLRAVADLRSRGLTLTVADGLSVTAIETATIGDMTGATVSMDPVRRSEMDLPVIDTALVPFPVIHKDFQVTARQLAVSRRGGTPLDTSGLEVASRKVAEAAEKLLLGTYGTYTFGGGSIYGYTNFPNRVTYTLTSPTHTAWTPDTLVNQILAMRQAAVDRHMFGPFMVYLSPGWDVYIDKDYSASKGDNTIRDRVKAITSIEDVQTVDFLTDYQIVMVQLTSDVVREAIGMDFTTLQWESHGGMQIDFKVMAIMIPNLRSDHNNNAGIIHGTGV